MSPTKGTEVLMKDDDFIVSKTDPKGKITYCNRVFMHIAGYLEQELLHQPHNIIRHPDMPRSVFRFMWNTLQQGEEFFGLVKNKTKSGGFYWTFTHVTPSFDAAGKLLGYYSVRRCPPRKSVELAGQLYRDMLAAEKAHSSSREAMDAGQAVLDKFVKNSGKGYDELVLSLKD